MLTEKIKIEFDMLYGMSLPEQTAWITNMLKDSGVQPVERSTSFTKNTFYQLGDCALVDISPKKFPMRRTPCILDVEDYNNLKGLYFRNEVRDTNIGGEYHKLPKITVSPVFIGNEMCRNVKVYRYIMNAPKGVPVDHVFKSVVINTRESLRLTTTVENLRNRMCTKGLSEEEKLLRMQHDFSKTWYVYVYWRMLGLISQEEAFAYNLEENS